MATKQLRDLELEFVGINPGHRHDSDKDLGTMNSPEQLINKPILSKEERDQLELMRLGKTPILKRKFGFLAIFGFSCTIMVTWEVVLVLYANGINNGGPPGVVFGFMLAWAGLASVYACLCELSSMAPTSGGQYFWVSMLAPTSSQRLLSYLTGWVTVCGWCALYTSASFLCVNMIQSLATLIHSEYQPKNWQTTLLMWASGLVAFAVNASSRKTLAWFVGTMFLLHVLAFFATIITLSTLGNYNTPSVVFDTWINNGNWPSQGVSFMIGLLSPVFGFVGVDGPIHMAEEIHQASVVVPRSVMFSMVVNGLLGLAVVFALTFTTPNFEAILGSTINYPYMEVLTEVTGGFSGAAVLVSAIIAMNLASTTTSLAAGSRLLWSFSRDRGVPFWQKLREVQPGSTIPLRCICVATMIMVLLSLIILGSSDVFNDVVSISIVGLYSSYLFPITLLLWRRATGGITSPSASPSDGVLFNSSGKQLVWGPWHIPGLLGLINNAVACAFMTVIWIFSFWPTSLPVTTQAMNYSSVIFVGVLVIAAVNYFWIGRKDYVGPVIEVGAR